MGSPRTRRRGTQQGPKSLCHGSPPRRKRNGAQPTAASRMKMLDLQLQFQVCRVVRSQVAMPSGRVLVPTTMAMSTAPPARATRSKRRRTRHLLGSRRDSSVLARNASIRDSMARATSAVTCGAVLRSSSSSALVAVILSRGRMRRTVTSRAVAAARRVLLATAVREARSSAMAARKTWRAAK